jgi:hypothetical protein
MPTHANFLPTVQASLIEEGKEAEERNKHYINELKQKIAELETKSVMLERAYDAMDQMIKEQGIEARHQRAGPRTRASTPFASPRPSGARTPWAGARA